MKKLSLLLIFISISFSNYSSIKNFKFVRSVVVALKQLDRFVLTDLALAVRTSERKVTFVESKLFGMPNLSDEDFESFKQQQIQKLCNLGLCEERNNECYVTPEAASVIGGCVTVVSGIDSDLPFYVTVQSGLYSFLSLFDNKP